MNIEELPHCIVRRSNSGTPARVELQRRLLEIECADVRRASVAAIT
jgi:hypothetical protein